MLLVYMTASSLEETESIATFVVDQRLASCANIIPAMRSIYRWKGKVERAEEVVCLFKTTEDRFEALREAIVAKHSYETPCIVALPISHSHPQFAAWVEEQSRPGI